MGLYGGEYCSMAGVLSGIQSVCMCLLGILRQRWGDKCRRCSKGPSIRESRGILSHQLSLVHFISREHL